MTIETFHALLQLVLIAIVVTKLTRFGHTLNKVERLGLGLMGGSGLLRADVIWQVQTSPYYSWAPTCFTMGVILCFGGRIWRDWRHEYRNMTARQQAREYLEARGKL